MRLTAECGELSPSFLGTALLSARFVASVRPNLLDMEPVPAEFPILDTPA